MDTQYNIAKITAAVKGNFIKKLNISCLSAICGV